MFTTTTEIQKYNRLGLNILPIDNNKRPLGEWKKWCDTPQNLDDVNQLAWNNAVGLGLVSGIGKLRCFDFDKVENSDIVYNFLQLLGLPRDYSWLERSGSGKGFHIFFRSEEFDRNEIGFKSPAKKDYTPLNGMCDHIELRWQNCQTIIAPTVIGGTKRYQWLNQEPTELPAMLDEHVITNTLRQTCIINATIKAEDKEYTSTVTKEDIESTTDYLTKIDNYDDWLKVGMALAHFVKVDIANKDFVIGFFTKISLDNKNQYSDSETDCFDKIIELINNCKGKVKIETLFYIAKKYGWRKAGDEYQSDYLKIDAFLKANYDIRYNLLIRQNECKPKNGIDKWKPIDDRDFSSFQVEADIKEGLKISNDKLKTYIYSNLIPDYDPLEDYFKNLPPYDFNQPSELAKLCKTVETDNNEVRDFLITKWFLNAIHGIFSPTETNSYCLVFQGGQGIGKSTWVQSIIPKKLKQYCTSGLGQAREKDSIIAICTSFLIDLDEMETLNKTEHSYLKFMLSTKRHEPRIAYDKFRTPLVRRSSFIGSINPSRFLKDSTGNRRWLCMVTKSMDWDAVNNIDADKLWAEAYTRYMQGDEYKFTQDEKDKINLNNEQFEIPQLEEELLMRYFIPDDEMKNANFKTTTEIFTILTTDKKYDITTQRLGNALSKCGFKWARKRMNGHRVQGYFVLRLADSHVEDLQYVPKEEEPKPKTILFDEDEF